MSIFIRYTLHMQHWKSCLRQEIAAHCLTHAHTAKQHFLVILGDETLMRGAAVKMRSTSFMKFLCH